MKLYSSNMQFNETSYVILKRIVSLARFGEKIHHDSFPTVSLVKPYEKIHHEGFPNVSLAKHEKIPLEFPTVSLAKPHEKICSEGFPIVSSVKPCEKIHIEGLPCSCCQLFCGHRIMKDNHMCLDTCCIHRPTVLRVQSLPHHHQLTQLNLNNSPVAAAIFIIQQWTVISLIFVVWLSTSRLEKNSSCISLCSECT